MMLRTAGFFRQSDAAGGSQRPGSHLLRLLAGLALLAIAGCQPSPSVSVRRLIDHQAMLDFSGLQPPAVLRDVKVLAPLPLGWDERPAIVNPLYIYRQWRSPGQDNAVGIVYLHLPFPMSARFLVWLAKGQYAQQRSREGQPQGQVLAQWTDSLGREWGDAENERVHIHGYAVTDGFDAWIVYSGYQLHSPIDPVELSLAARSIDGIVPIPMMSTKK